MTPLRQLHPSIEPATPPDKPVRWIGVAWRKNGEWVTVGRWASAAQATVVAKTAYAARDMLVRTDMWRDVAPQDLEVSRLADDEHY